MKKTLGAIVVCSFALALAYTNCAKQDSPAGTTADTPPPGGGPLATPTPAPGASCAHAAARPGRAVTYGDFTSGMDSCNAFTGSTSRWTGMDPNVAMIALPVSYYANGAACGACVEIEGPAGKVIGRVATLCPECEEDVVDMNRAAFTAVTGATDGRVAVTVRPIACEVSEGLRFTMNEGTNPYYLNMSPSNYRHPIATLEVDLGSGFVAMTRLGNTNAFQYAAGTSTTSPVQVRATDVFGQAITTSVDSNAGQSTLTSQQFGNCSAP